LVLGLVLFNLIRNIGRSQRLSDQAVPVLGEHEETPVHAVGD
jgi:hypothetical protein